MFLAAVSNRAAIQQEVIAKYPHVKNPKISEILLHAIDRAVEDKEGNPNCYAFFRRFVDRTIDDAMMRVNLSSRLKYELSKKLDSIERKCKKDSEPLRIQSIVIEFPGIFHRSQIRLVNGEVFANGTPQSWRKEHIYSQPISENQGSPGVRM